MQSKYFCRKSQKTVLWSFFVCFDKNRFLCGASFAFVSKFVLERGDSGWSNFQLIEFLIGRKAVKLKILHLQLLTSDGLNFAKARSSWQRQNKFLFDRTSIKDFFLVLLTSLSHSINWKIDQTGSSRPDNKLGSGGFFVARDHLTSIISTGATLERSGITVTYLSGPSIVDWERKKSALEKIDERSRARSWNEPYLFEPDPILSF